MPELADLTVPLHHTLPRTRQHQHHYYHYKNVNNRYSHDHLHWYITHYILNMYSYLLPLTELKVWSTEKQSRVYMQWIVKTLRFKTEFYLFISMTLITILQLCFIAKIGFFLNELIWGELLYGYSKCRGQLACSEVINADYSWPVT